MARTEHHSSMTQIVVSNPSFINALFRLLKKESSWFWQIPSLSAAGFHRNLKSSCSHGPRHHGPGVEELWRSSLREEKAQVCGGEQGRRN